jgi:hypothetical protein
VCAARAHVRTPNIFPPLNSARGQALVALAPHLPETLLREALAAATAISDDRSRAEALTALAPHLPETLLREALAAATAISNDLARATALTALAPHLPETLLREALAAATAISNDRARATALTALAPHLPETERQPVLREALAAAATLSGDYVLPHVGAAPLRSTQPTEQAQQVRAKRKTKGPLVAPFFGIHQPGCGSGTVNA